MNGSLGNIYGIEYGPWQEEPQPIADAGEDSDDDSMPKSPVPESLSSTPATKGSSVVFSDDGTDGGENNQDRQDHGYIKINISL